MGASADQHATSVGRAVLMAGRRLTARSAAALVAQGLTGAAWWMLTELAAGPADGLPLGEVARRVQLGASTATAISDQLADRGLLTRRRSVDDRRRVVAAITDEGRRLVDEVRADIDRALEDDYRRLTAEEQDTLKQLLSRLAGDGSYTT